MSGFGGNGSRNCSSRNSVSGGARDVVMNIDRNSPFSVHQTFDRDCGSCRWCRSCGFSIWSLQNSMIGTNFSTGETRVATSGRDGLYLARRTEEEAGPKKSYNNKRNLENM